MKSLLLPLFLFFFFLGNAQDTKQVVYYSPDWVEISEEEYQIFNTQRDQFLTLTYELDTAIIAKAFVRQKKSRFSKDAYQSIKNHLQNISGRKIKKNTVLVINYFPETSLIDYQGIFNENEDYFKKYSKLLNKYNFVEQFWVGALENDKIILNDFELLGDQNKFFEENFFPYYYPYGSYIIIYPSRRYFMFLGEHDLLDIYEKVKTYKKKRRKKG